MLYLLYGQSLELIRLYNQEFGEKFLEKEKYYLVGKKWLDDYKNSLEFNLIKEDAEKYQYDSYEIFKSKITSRLKKGLTNITKKPLKIDPPDLNQKLLADYEILIPKNFVLVKKRNFRIFFFKISFNI